MADFLYRIRDAEDLQYIDHVVLDNKDIMRHPAVAEVLGFY